MYILIIIFAILFIYYLNYIFIFYKGLDRKYFHPNPQQPFVSVVVAAKNEEKNIPNLLTTLINQNYPEDKYEIIIANDQSIDNTYDIIQRFQAQFNNIVLINSKTNHKNISRKKNALSQAIEISKGEIILTTDADCIVKLSWISEIVRYFGKNVGMVCGFSTPYLTNTNKINLVAKLEYFDTLALFSAAAGAIGKNKAFSCSGQNLAFTRKAYEKVDGYKSIMQYESGDDILLMQLIKNAGFDIRFVFSETAYNFTVSEKNLKNFLNQRIRWASNEAVQIRLNLEFYIFLLGVFLLNIIILISIFIYPALLPIFFFLKIIPEFIIIKKGIERFKISKKLLKFFPVWALMQPFYILLTGVGGKLKLYKW